MTIPILIPAYRPNKQLVDLTDRLIESGIRNIIIVNDGSGPESEEVFDQIKKNQYCRVCNHAINMGKGRAIKTGLNFALLNYPELKGIVTADADGQHSAEDIIKVQKKLSEFPDNLIIGCRNFRDNVPFRSKIGNEITKRIFYLLTGIKVSDTQTGLRGIPLRYIPPCLKLEGEKYEYEINMLVSCGKHNISLTEVPIETIYIDQNVSSHFNPVFDSIRIYFVLFRFLLSSLTTSAIDFFVFILCTRFSLSILLSTTIARIIAGNYNFVVNKKIVFKSQSKPVWAFIKYWLLVLVLGSLSYLGIMAAVSFLHFNLLLSKALIEMLLFFVSFTIQRSFVFHSTENSNGKY